MCTVVTLLKTRGDRVGSKSPALRSLQSWIPSPFLLGLFPLADFRTRNVKYCCVIISPLFIPFTPFYELQIMQASFVLSLKVDLIAAPNCEIYQFYQSYFLSFWIIRFYQQCFLGFWEESEWHSWGISRYLVSYQGKVLRTDLRIEAGR